MPQCPLLLEDDSTGHYRPHSRAEQSFIATASNSMAMYQGYFIARDRFIILYIYFFSMNALNAS
jgi:hypothetical protein